VTGLPLDGVDAGALPAQTVIVPAPAKVNPFLRVLGRRDDGFHDLETVVLPIDLADRLQIHAFADASSFRTLSLSLEATGDPGLLARVPLDESNLILRAAHALAVAGEVRGFAEFVLEKRVPVAAGLGGGSADAAAALRALNRLWALGMPDDELCAVGAAVGSDVPALLMGGPCVARGRGERVEPAAAPGVNLVVIGFSFGVSTEDAFRWWDEEGATTGPDPAAFLGSLERLAGEPGPHAPASLAAVLHNDLEGPVAARHPVVGDARNRLESAGVPAVVMTGSGPTLIGVVSSRLDSDAERDLEDIAGRPVRYAASTTVG
jgi:4-diphosphocytidyl-2-C-methyl-D-erythritol kinase